MELPREVVQHIFTLRESPADYHSLITLKERVRCQAVCRAWREYLSPASWPLEELNISLEGSTEYDTNVAPVQWVFQTQPPACSMSIEDYAANPGQYSEQLCSYLSLPHRELRELYLSLSFELVRAVWPAVCALRGLKHLCLSDEMCECVMDGPMAAGLPSTLESLDICSWKVVELRWPEPLLLGLTRLMCLCVNPLALGATLPSLRELVVEDSWEVNLASANLALPQLTLLDVNASCLDDSWGTAPTLKVDFERMPLLASLGIHYMALEEATVFTFAGLAHLTRLTVDCHDALTELEAVSLLQQAPTTLRSLRVIGSSGFACLAHGLCRLTGLASLTGDCAVAVLPLLGSTHALRELEVHLQGDGGFGLHISRLTQLTKLSANHPSIIPHLAPLSQLRELCLLDTNAAALGKEGISLLAAMPCLRKLDFKIWGVADRASAHLEALRTAMPSCKVICSS